MCEFQLISATKFILVLCNPIDRAYSDFNHKMRKSVKFQNFLKEEKIENFDDFVMRYSPKLRTMKEKRLENLLEEGVYQEGKHWYSTLTGNCTFPIFVISDFYFSRILLVSFEKVS